MEGVVPLAAACFLLSYVESVSAGRTLAERHDDTIQPRQELLGLGAANLAAGAHRFKVRYNWNGGAGYLELFWTPPNGQRTLIGPDAFHTEGGAWSPGSVTEHGVRENVSVGIQYIAWWLAGTGAAAINNLMEDAATAEISRSQIWQWVHRHATLDDGRSVDAALVRSIVDEEVAAMRETVPGPVAVAVPTDEPRLRTGNTTTNTHAPATRRINGRRLVDARRRDAEFDAERSEQLAPSRRRRREHEHR